MRGTPLGRQLAWGSSFDWRASMIFFADGNSGMVWPFFRPCAMSPIGPPPCHSPDKSGRPPASRGAGRFDCASGAATAIATTAAMTAFIARTISRPSLDDRMSSRHHP
jgi:hypothetical protein